MKKSSSKMKMCGGSKNSVHPCESSAKELKREREMKVRLLINPD